MKKPLILLSAGLIMLAVGAAAFAAALSAPTVTGPAFMRVVWEAWMAAGLVLTALATVAAVVKPVKGK